MAPNKRFVVDTNTLLSSLFVKNSIPFKAVEKAKTNGFFFSNDTFLEFETVLFRKKFDKYFSEQERLVIVELFYSGSEFIEVTSNIRACRDANDDKFLNLAIDAAADCIITGDNDLLVLNPFERILILSPFDFVATFLVENDI